MKEQPARAIRRFEVLMLRPLNVALPVAAGVCLVKTAWILAVVMAVPCIACEDDKRHKREHNERNAYDSLHPRRVVNAGSPKPNKRVHTGNPFKGRSISSRKARGEIVSTGGQSNLKE